MSLRSYVISRILLTIPMLMFLLTLVFLILRVMPGDPALLHFEKNVDPEVLAEFKARLGLDKPLLQQYFDYLFGVFRGDFGLSMQDFQPVTKQILDRFPATLELTVWAMLFAVIIGVFLGIVSAKNYDTFKDNSIRIFGIVTYAIPVFFLGMILQLIFGTYLHWLPTGSQIDPRLQPPRVTGMVTIDSLLAGNFYAFVDAVRHLILPAVTLGTVLCGIFIRLTRTNMLETLRMDFVVAAEARGLSDQTITYRYALKNAFLPILTMIGLQFAALLAGAVLTETTFSWNGLGTYLVDRISRRDYTAIQGTVVFFGLLVMLVTLVVDILYAYLDPRIRL
ncbi:MAG: ABC transporter permease [Candidatus Thorarchaeota archaeon]|nr:MAG: ABC transporter permease [Candidatus Thorarchaeota archaeon]RLI60963.1 MAG: ABC transporter permease [Candidatus Thorarchaeota archaeon]